MPFTACSAANDHTALGCFERHYRGDEFLHVDYAGQHVRINAPESSAADHIAHSLQCKQSAPHGTSASVLVPARFATSYSRRLLKGMVVIMQRKLHGAPWNVYYDARSPQLVASTAMSSDNSLVMHYDSMVAGSPATLLVDTGASHAYLSKRFTQRMGVSVRPSKAVVTLADGTLSHVAGICTLQLRCHALMTC